MRPDSTMHLISMLQSLQAHKELCHMTTDDIFRYARFVQHLKNNILLAQPPELTDQKDINCAPEILPRSIALFLCQALALLQDYIQDSWDILKDHVWACAKVELTQEDRESFKLYGWKLGISTCVFEYIALILNRISCLYSFST